MESARVTPVVPETVYCKRLSDETIARPRWLNFIVHRNQLLTEMDGVGTNKNVFVIGKSPRIRSC